MLVGRRLRLRERVGNALRNNWERAMVTKSKAKNPAYRSNVMEGATSKRAVRIRISMIARERGLLDAEIAKAMNCGTKAMVNLAEKHDLSLDWLWMGDLKGLLRTVRWKQQHGEAERS
jgi:hypothetical protein